MLTAGVSRCAVAKWGYDRVPPASSVLRAIKLRHLRRWAQRCA
jgi:hypothetical protein